MVSDALHVRTTGESHYVLRDVISAPHGQEITNPGFAIILRITRLQNGHLTLPTVPMGTEIMLARLLGVIENSERYSSGTETNDLPAEW